MNYFAHAIPFLDNPYFAVGTGVPDWLTVVDRRVRLRRKQLVAFLDDADPCVAAVARGVDQHLRDDAHFHGTRTFAELSLLLAGMARGCLRGDSGFRPGFLGHLLLEVLLDDALIKAHPGKLEEYYAVLRKIDHARVQQIVNRMAPRPTDRLGKMISEFSRQRILSDYRKSDKLWVRLNQVMRRVGLEELPRRLVVILPLARRLVAGRVTELLEGIPTSPARITQDTPTTAASRPIKTEYPSRPK